MNIKNIFLLTTQLITLASLSNIESIKVSAEKGSRPENINTSYLSDEELSFFYSTAKGKKGLDLRLSLNTLVENHIEYDYQSNNDRDIYKIIDRNWDFSPLSEQELTNYNYNDNPYIIKLYADYNDDITRADRFKNEGASRVSFDKEHIWAQSLGKFGRDGGAGSDFHALWPSDVRGNQHAHNNNNFGVPTSGITSYVGDAGGANFPSRTSGTYVGRNGYISGSSHKVFEPIDEYKGDIARAMFYMPVRYATYVDTDHPFLDLVDGSPSPVTSTSEIPGLAGDLATLLQWNEDDPVSEHEIRRNNLIFNNYQKNRNPFIDYPDLARVVYDKSYTGEGASFALGSSSVGENTAEVVGISLDTSNAKVKYAKDETFSLSGLIVKVKYDDNTSRTTSSYTSSLAEGTLLSNIGVQVVTISYQYEGTTYKASYTILVNEDNVPIDENEYDPITILLIVGGVVAVIIIIIIGIVFYSKANKKTKKKINRLIKNKVKKTVKKKK